MVKIIFNSILRAYSITDGDKVEKVRAGRDAYIRWFSGSVTKKIYYKKYHEDVDALLIENNLADCIVVFE